MSLGIPLGVKLGQLFTVTIFFIAVFAKVYHKIFKWSYEDALYNSIHIQTLTGGGIKSDTSLENFVISAQTIISYLVTSGLIIVSLNI